VGREGSGGIVRHLLKYLDDESEGKTIQKSIPIMKDPKCVTYQRKHRVAV